MLQMTIPSQVLRTLLYGSWERSTASLWLLSSLKENHLGSQPTKTVSRIFPAQKWEVIREGQTCMGLSGNCYRTGTSLGSPDCHSRSLWITLCSLILWSFAPSLRAALSTKPSLSISFLHQRVISRYLFMGSLQIGKTHSFLYLLEFILKEVGWRVIALSWNQCVSYREDNGQDDIMWLAG